MNKNDELTLSFERKMWTELREEPEHRSKADMYYYQQLCAFREQAVGRADEEYRLAIEADIDSLTQVMLKETPHAR